MGRWLSPMERAQEKLRLIPHLTMKNNHENLVWLRQPTLFEVYSVVKFAEGERRLHWNLPGHGVAMNDCGRGFLKGCDNHFSHENGKDFVRIKRHNCGRKGCPICYESWSSLQAERGLLRFATYFSDFHYVEKAILDSKRKNKGKCSHDFHTDLDFKLEAFIHSRRKKVKHIVVSPPQDLVCESMEDYVRLKKSAYQISRESGVYAGAMIFHPYRLKCVSCGSPIADYEGECQNCGESAFAWFWSPHFHIVGLGWVEFTSEGYSNHGWVVKNLGVRNSVFWTFQYILSHAGVSSLHTTTWFGKLAYNQVGKVPRSDGFMEVCPFCSHALIPLVWLGGEDRPPPVYDECEEKNELLLEIGFVGRL